MDEQDLKALASLLSSRPVTTAEAADVLGESLERTRERLARLAEGQQVVWDGELVGYESPELRTIAAVNGHLDAVRSRLDTVESLLHDLPSLVSSWVSGVPAAGDSHVIESLRGRVPMAEVWARQLSWEPPERVRMFLPEVETAEQVGQDRDRAEEFLRATGMDLRCIVTADHFASPDPTAPFAVQPPSVQVRIHPRVPGWMMVSGTTLVLPAQWGRPDLVDLLMVTHPALAAAMTDYFDLLWDQSVPVPGRGGPHEAPDIWDDLLELLAQGMTIEAAGRSLGLSARTAQRRVHAAMQHFGVTSHFALAVAWARFRAARG